MKLTFRKGNIRVWFDRDEYTEKRGYECKELPFGLFAHAAHTRDEGSVPKPVWNVTHTKSGFTAGVFNSLADAKRFLDYLATWDMDWDFDTEVAKTFWKNADKAKLRNLLDASPVPMVIRGHILH